MRELAAGIKVLRYGETVRVRRYSSFLISLNNGYTHTVTNRMPSLRMLYDNATDNISSA